MHGRILVAVDGSEPSLKGLRMAIDLAKGTAATLQVVTVEPPVLLPPAVYAEAIEKLEHAQRVHAASVLREAGKIAADAGLACDTVQLTGAPAEAIADFAKEEAVTLVVIGAKGHNALSRMMLGSVTDRLVHVCPKPVLVVR